MTIDEHDFTIALCELADRDPVTAPPTAQVLRRARRARRGRTAALTAATLALVATAGGLAVGLDRRGPAPTTATTSTTSTAPVIAAGPAE